MFGIALRLGTLGRSSSLPPIIATGGSITTTNINGFNYKIHQFTSVGNSTFTVTSGGLIDILLVGGGQAGDSSLNSSANGGSAGDVLYYTNIMINSGTYTFTVGRGGTGFNPADGYNWTNPTNTTALGFTAIGGHANGYSKGTPNTGYTGGGAGGAGAGGNGFNGGNYSSGQGGSAMTVDILGYNTSYGGGGGGAAGNSNGNYGQGGGATAGRGNSQSPGNFNYFSADPNTGSGGGAGSGSGYTGYSGNGGSGIIILRYQV